MPSCHPHTLAYHSFTDAEVEAIRSHLLAWYRTNRRRLPWRGDPPPYGAAAKQQQQPRPNSTTDPTSITSNTPSTNNTLSRYFTTTTSSTSPTTPTYKRRKPSPPPQLQPASLTPPTPTPRVPVSAYGVWVSEVMLQQTRVETVIAYYTRWMQRFPTITQLATASLDDVNSAWSGLGYYRRARMLHEAAKHVVATLQGRLPDSVSGLLDIAGIGPYTAGAIASIAYNKPVPLVDGNVSRVLSRLRALHAPPEKKALALHWQLAHQLAADSGSSGGSSEQTTDASDWSQAVMELGAVVCMPRVAECGRCPVRRWCRAAEEVAERQRPVGDERWTLGRRRVEVEVETEAEEIEHNKKSNRVKLAGQAEEREQEMDTEHANNGAVKSKRRGGSGREWGKQSNTQPKTIVLDDTLCTICEPQATAPTTVFDYPTKAVKKSPTDEHVSVCVVSRKRVRGGERSGEVEWLLVQRLPDGLLAGQWEFPSVVHPPSSTARTPTAAQRRQLLKDGLFLLLPTWLAELVGSSNRESVGELTHVFSHRRHLMHVQRCVVEERVEDGATEGTSMDGRRWRWMTESEITTTGLTTGQRKVWALSRGAKMKVATNDERPAARKKRKELSEREQKSAEVAHDDVDESGDRDGGEQSEEAADEEWEVWPTFALSDNTLVEANGVIVIDP